MLPAFTTFKKIPVSSPPSPRTFRFFQAHGATVTMEGLDLSTAVVSEEEAAEFLRQKALSFDRHYTISRSNGTFECAHGTLQVPENIHIDLQGSHDGVTFAVRCTNISSDQPGVFTIGLLDERTNRCEEIISVTKSTGQDFAFQHFSKKPNEQMTINVAVVDVPSNYMQLGWKVNSISSLQTPRRLLQFNCDDNTVWINKPTVNNLPSYR